MTARLPLMIFAAGFGTRMGALTRDRPKPMIEVGGRSMLSRAVEIGRDAGCAPLVANTHYLAETISPVLEDAGALRSHEPGPILDTGGGLKRALPLLEGPVVATLNPDAVWLGSNPLKALIRHGLPEGVDVLLLVVPIERAHGHLGEGDFDIVDGTPRRKGPFVYTGAQIVRTEVVAQHPGEVFSLNSVWDRVGAEDRLAACVYDGEWCDIGHPDGLHLAERLLKERAT